MKRCCIRLWHLSKLLSPREHTHPPVGRLKRAIDSSKKSQIKTSTNCGGKKQLLHKVMSRGLPHESKKLSKELWERKMKFSRKKKVNVFLILSSTCNNEGVWALRYDTPGAVSILKGLQQPHYLPQLTSDPSSSLSQAGSSASRHQTNSPATLLYIIAIWTAFWARLKTKKPSRLIPQITKWIFYLISI